jgi:hypothetical protein
MATVDLLLVNGDEEFIRILKTPKFDDAMAIWKVIRRWSSKANVITRPIMIDSKNLPNCERMFRFAKD